MRHEEIQRIYRNHYFTSFRNMGGVKQLSGSVDVIVFFVNDSRSTWTESAKQRYRTVQKAAMKLLLDDAKKRGVSLQIRNAYVDASVPMNCTRDNKYVWSKAIISRYGVSDIPAYQDKHEAVKRCAEAPILFVFNKSFRSSAVSVDWLSRTYGEMAIISSDYSVHTIAHELLHQFGAVDLYYPAEVLKLIQRIGYDSIMAYHASTHIDSLTAYLIGWTKEIDSSAVLILEKTKHITREYMVNEIQRQYQNP